MSILHEILHTNKRRVGNALRKFSKLTPQKIMDSRSLMADRDASEHLLHLESCESEAHFEGRVLVDATFDNPGYWFRYCLVRKALGLAKANEVGVLGPYNAKKCKKTLLNFNIHHNVKYPDVCPATSDLRKEAQRIIRETHNASDIMSWKLPYDFPGKLIYDGIQKKQRTPVVDVRAPLFEMHVVEVLRCIEAASMLLTDDTKLVVLSHAMNYDYGPLAWIASKRGIPVIVLSGFYGTPRFWKINVPEDIYKIASRPKLDEFKAFPLAIRTKLAQVFREYLDDRMNGQATDVGAWYAYNSKHDRLTRPEIAKGFGWDSSKPIVVVYAPHWFDGPHLHGMKNFRDFLDWLECILGVAKGVTDVNWLLKNHPCEDFYGGIKLHELAASVKSPHIRLVDRNWNNAAVMSAADAIVTYHGTIGIEATAIGKPVLVADVGWYDDLGFVKAATSREDFLNLLGKAWWKDLATKPNAENAQVFGGLYFTIPEDQSSMVLPDDANQQKIYTFMKGHIGKIHEDFEREAKCIRDWWSDSSQHYHVYRMLKAKGFFSPTDLPKIKLDS